MKEEKEKIIAVLAGNIQEYNFLKDEQEHTVFLRSMCSIHRYIEYPDKLRGMELSDVITIGTFWDRVDARDFYDLARSRIR